MVAPNSNPIDRLLIPVAECLTPESATRLVHLEIAPETRSRIEDLASKANEGELTDAERSEYRDYVETMDFIGILQAKARQMLARPTGS